MDDATRVVLVKPGDILFLGNLGTMPPETAQRLVRDVRQATGVKEVFLFGADIDLAMVPGE